MLPILPEVWDDVCVEVGVAVVQGQGEGEQEPAQRAQAAPPVGGHQPRQGADNLEHGDICCVCADSTFNSTWILYLDHYLETVLSMHCLTKITRIQHTIMCKNNKYLQMFCEKIIIMFAFEILQTT